MITKNHSIIAAAVIILALQAIVLYGLGRTLVCPCGYVQIWDNVVKGPGNSQQLFDWFSFSHFAYGFILYFLLWVLNKKWGWLPEILLLITLLISVAWEIFENVYFAAPHPYQELYAGYGGDSILNSLMDTVMMGLGFLLAYRWPVKITVPLVIGIEIMMTFIIKDNVVFDLVTFVHPISPILQWQAG